MSLALARQDQEAQRNRGRGARPQADSKTQNKRWQQGQKQRRLLPGFRIAPPAFVQQGRQSQQSKIQRRQIVIDELVTADGDPHRQVESIARYQKSWNHALASYSIDGGE